MQILVLGGIKFIQGDQVPSGYRKETCKSTHEIPFSFANNKQKQQCMGIFQRRVSPSFDGNVDPWKNKFHEVMKRNGYSG